jgi:nucleoid DNA-binding protein
MDAQNDLSVGAFVQGKGLKFNGLGTLHIVSLKERNYKVPDGKGGWMEGTAPAHKTVHFDASEVLLDKMNNPLEGA